MSEQIDTTVYFAAGGTLLFFVIAIIAISVSVAFIRKSKFTPRQYREYNY